MGRANRLLGVDCRQTRLIVSSGPRSGHHHTRGDTNMSDQDWLRGAAHDAVATPQAASKTS